jgi:hypothetical protein
MDRKSKIFLGSSCWLESSSRTSSDVDRPVLVFPTGFKPSFLKRIS